MMSVPEVAVIGAVVLALLFLGPKQIPKLARQWRQAVAEVKKEVAGEAKDEAPPSP